MCKETFELASEYSEEEARAEAIKTFGTDPKDTYMESVCSECYHKMKEIYPPEQFMEDFYKNTHYKNKH